MMKKTALILCMLVMVIFQNVARAEDEKLWKDASPWAIETLEQSKEISLYPECFNDADLTVNITRAEFAEISVGVYETITGKSVNGTKNPFEDSNNNYVMSAYELGIVEGVSDKLFAPLDDITREAVATMLNRAYSVSVEAEDEKEVKKEKFSDDEEISEWAYESVYDLAEKGYIKGTDEGFKPLSSCTREQALVIATRLVNDIKGLGTAGEEGIEKEEYVIAYIGGSLTESGENWRTMVTRYIQNKMPDKKVVDYSAGIGGTCSDYGAVRYMENVLSKEPDLVFMDSAINDATFGTTDEMKHQKYVESMIRQSIKSEKVPAIVFIYMPYPGEKTHKTYVASKFSADAKEKLANHYNIPSIYIQDYMTYKYNSEASGTKYMDWLANYYNEEGEGYNVHPKGVGYSLYGEAILDAFEKKGFENFINPVEDKTIFCMSEKDMLESEYNYIKANDDRVKTEGNWKIYKSPDDYDKTGDVPNTKYNSYPFFEEGIWHTSEKNAKLSFSTDAKRIHISYISYSEGNSATVYVDGKRAGTITTKSSYHNMNYITSIDVAKDGKQHTVELVVDNYAYKFDIGAIIEEK